MKAEYSKLHKRWIVTNPNRPELIIGSGKTQIRRRGKCAAEFKPGIRLGN